MHACAVQYCQKECQKKDYSRHKKECGALAVARGDHPAPLSGAKGENETTTSNTGKTKSNAGVSDQAFEKVAYCVWKRSNEKLKQFIKKHPNEIHVHVNKKHSLYLSSISLTAVHHCFQK